MRHLCLAAVLLALPLAAAAQNDRQDRRDDRRSDAHQSDQRQGNTAARPPANQATPAWEQKQTPWWEKQAPPPWERKPNTPASNATQQTTPGHQGDHDNDRGGRRQHPASVVYVQDYRFLPGILPGTNQFYVTPPAPNAPVAQSPAPTIALGALHFDVEPRDLQIFVDGAFVGTPVDLADQIELTPGTRRIELRARGYKTLTFHVEIVQDRTITYRGALERDAPPPAPEARKAPDAPQAPRPTAPTTIYMIPGCYLGNVAPKASELRSGCDINKLTKTSM